MPSDSDAIIATGLGKRYRSTATGAKYRSLREDLTAMARRFTGKGRATAGWKWALRDVDLRIPCGETVGIIGGNGAGKTTLLRLLARITEPSAGEARIAGRIGAMLEVGTGFHPELSGRENIWLAGAVMGMTRSEVAQRFDRIVEFAEAEPHLDLPVKRWSSGMHMRLAFSVAAHLEPDILVVDEVLAVGDARFQARCMDRMHDAARGGRTILLVSHSMPAIRRLCRRAIWLENGSVRQEGPADSVVSAYLRDALPDQPGGDIPARLAALPRDADVRLESISVRQSDSPCRTILAAEPFSIEVRWRVLRRVAALRIYVDVLDEDQVMLCRLFHDEDEDISEPKDLGTYLSRVELPADSLGKRTYHLVVGAMIFGERYCTGDGVPVRLDVIIPGRLSRAHSESYPYNRMHPGARWSTQRCDEQTA
jgi:lipopolysaccharide transport system ATP-binding protein